MNPINDAPVAIDDNAITAENTSVNLTVDDIVTPNDTDLDGDTLTISAVSNPVNGSVVLNANGSVTFSPDANFSGEATFDYTVSDGNGGTDTATVTVYVPGLNDNAGDVYEEALPGGSNSASTAEVTTGNLLADDIALPNGLSLAVTIAGGSVDNSTVGQSVITTAEGNTLVVNTDNSSANFGDYTYTLINAVNHKVVEHSFGSNREGWSGSGVSQQSNSLRIGRDSTATQTFSFGADMAGEQVTLMFDVRTTGGWETSGGSQDYFNVIANGSTVESFSPANGSTTQVSTTLTLDSNGSVVVALNANTTANNEVAYVDNLSLSTLERADEFTYTLSDGVGFSDSATLNISIHDDQADTPRDYGESVSITEDQNIALGALNLLENTTPQSSSNSIASVTGLTLLVNGVNAASEFTITNESTSAGEVAKYSFVHNGTYASAELVVYENGDVAWTNVDNHLLDFLAVGEDAQLAFNYSVATSNGTFDSAATLNISGANDAPVAVTDTGLSSGGFASEFWVYNEGVDGPNLSTISQVIGFTGSNAPDAGFITTGFDYSVVRNDSDYRANLGTGSNLESWLADNGDDSSVIRYTTQSSGDAIVRFAGVFDVAEDGIYDFNIRHDDGFVVFIDGQQTFVADFITAPSNYSESTFLTAGSHEVEIYYWDQGGEYVFDGSLFDSFGNDMWTPVNMSYRGAPITTDEDSAITIDVLANDTDIDGDTLSVSAITNGTYGTVTTNGQTVTYTPNSGFFGQDSFTYTVSDGNGGTDTIAVPVEVRPANNAPVIDLDADDSSGKANGGYFDAGPTWNPLPITDADLLISDLDGTRLFSAEIQIVNPQAGDSLTVNGSLPGGLSYNYNASSSTATIGGVATHADYVNALKMVGFDDDGSVNGARDISITIYDGNDHSASVTSTIYVTDNQQLGNAGDNTIDTSGWGGSQSLTLKGFDGNDNLRAGDADDVLIGGLGDDTLAGDGGSDLLVGGLGADTFAWHLGDKGVLADPAEDVVMDFSLSQGDSLDLSDLLLNESEDNISDYLYAESDGVDTVIRVSNFDGLSAGGYNGELEKTDQIITLEGVDMSGFSSSGEIIQYLLDNNHLVID